VMADELSRQTRSLCLPSATTTADGIYLSFQSTAEKTTYKIALSLRLFTQN
jgi:hypothetical protein